VLSQNSPAVAEKIMKNSEQPMSQPRFKYLFCLSVTPNNLGLNGHREYTSGIKID